jgi:nucleoid-associated protein YgaU
MAKDAKIGSLIGLVLIFIIAFVINGFTRPGDRKGRGEPSSVTADNTSNNSTLRPDAVDRPIQPVPKGAEGHLPPNAEGITGSYASIPATEPTRPEPVTDGNPVVPESDARTFSLSQVYYVVCEGDNLADIAKKFYGPEEGNKRANILRIFLANRKVLTSPHEIFVGQKIVIPPLDFLKPDESLFSHSMFETVKSIGRIHVSTDNHAAKQSRLYAVQEGDSLWSIATTLFGDGSRYKEISKLNSGILKDEDRLVVGMRLRVPAQ